MKSSERVALNTGLLYGKMILSIIITLFSTRLVLKALGIEDYGIFQVVMGVTAMLSFLNAAMSVSTQRYLSYYLGSGQINLQRKVFETSTIIHLIIGVGIVILLEVAGLFVFDGFLEIPEERISTAKTVYQFMIISVFFTINAVPYDSSIVAHENMLLDSIVGIFEALAKLTIAITVLYTNHDKLILYGLLFSILTIVSRIIKSTYCIRKYDECTLKINPKIDKTLMKEMFSFAGWNTFVTFCNVINGHGIAIIMNVHFGVAINAATGISRQVFSQLQAFSSNINKSFKPQIMKSEGEGLRERMIRLAMLTCKLSFLLLSFLAIPLLLEMQYIFDLWLEEVPEYAVIFSKLTLFLSLSMQLYWGIGIAIQSVGDIKKYQLITGSILILIIPIAIIILKLGFPPQSVYISSLAIDIIVAGVTVYFAKKLASLNVNVFLKKTVLPSVFVAVIAYIIGLTPSLLLDQSFIRLLITVASTTMILLILSWTIALEKYEREKIISLIKGLIKKFRT